MEQENFTIKLSQYLRARFSFLSISTWEEDRVIRDIQKICSDEKLIKTTRKLYTWSLTEGLVNDEMKPTRNSKQPIQALEQIQRIEEPSVFVLKDFHVYMGGENRQPDPGVIRKIRDLVSVIERSPYPKNVIFVSPTFSIPLELQKDIIFVEYGLPTYNDLKRVLNQMIEMNKSNDRIVVDLDASEEEMLIKAALGLTLQEAENAFALSMVTDGRLDINSVDHVLKEKQQIIKKNGLLEYIPQDPSMADVGGLENIKRWLQKRNHSWMDSASEYSLPAPKGILLTSYPIAELPKKLPWY